MNIVPPAKAITALQISPENVGKEAATIPVELSARFLQHFSEQLYSSPQKAFEELISNSWDAGADCVDVRIAENLQDPSATLCVLDNGASMDETGLRELWHIAFSPKSSKPQQFGRQVIGKFGIGKLATYVLAGKIDLPLQSGRRKNSSSHDGLSHAADQNFPFWVALAEKKCTGANFHKLREFCREHKLSLSRHGHSVTWQHKYYQVFMFAEEEHAEVFRKEFGGDPMHPSERGKGKNWARWKKGTHNSES